MKNRLTITGLLSISLTCFAVQPVDTFNLVSDFRNRETVVLSDAARYEASQRALKERLFNTAVSILQEKTQKIANGQTRVLPPETVFLATTSGEICRVYLRSTEDFKPFNDAFIECR